ncbi:permease prefix domain 1-containing protein [Emergencia timonensis]|uniref:permease prefix domain 1-containing protein n=1 Tax=Emergencia timonensis TaxID=1776384 RepID=UPI0039F5EA12
MEIILNYLDSMFTQLPDTEEVRKAKGEMASMMEDKYVELKAEGKSENEAIGIVISEFGNMEELIRELGIREKSAPSITINEDKRKPSMKINLSRGKEYLDDMRQYARKIGIGVVLCICSPILLINSGVRTDAAAPTAMGLIVLFGMVAAAVVLLIVNGVSMSKYEYLQQEVFELEPGAKTIFGKMQEEARSTFGRKMAIGVSLIIIGVIPAIVAGIIFDESQAAKIGAAVSLLLLFVAAGVYILITAGMPYGCYDVLLQKGDYTVERKKNKLIDKVAAIYWPLIVAIYLAYSFLTEDWGRSWIIWPVAGVLFGAIAGICSISSKNENDR